MLTAGTMQRSASEISQASPDALAVLLTRVADSRDRAAFRELFVHFAPRIKGLMLRKGVTPELAEDLAQETMLAVWSKAALYQAGRGSVATWVFTIARNLRIDRLRRESSRHFEDVDGMEIAEADATPGAAPRPQDEAMIARQEQGLVAEAIATLPGEQAEIIRLSFAADLSQSEIAERLGLPLGTVKSRMRLAYQKLRQCLEDVT